MPISDYRTALVTGASSGIGAAVVHALTERGLRVHAVARRRDRLQELASRTGCETQVLDVLDTDAVYDTLPTLEADVLVNNAGLGRGFDTLWQASREDIDRTLATNVTAATHVLRAVVSGMVQRRRGHVVNIGSVAGLYPLLSALYGASKGAVHLLAQNLRSELRGTRVRSTEICPARVHTEFFDHAIDDPEKAKEMLGGFGVLRPEDIASAIVFALDMPWHVNVSTIEITPTEQHIGGITVVPAPP
jgi:NADP-dependent 3-hydroxy acid dehydrogenase YdfG